MAPQLKTLRLTSDHENPQVILHRNWFGHAVVATESRGLPMKVETPDVVTIPMFETMGPVTQAREVEALRRVYEKPSDIYIVHCTTPAGAQTRGLIAVPRAVVPIVEIA